MKLRLLLAAVGVSAACLVAAGDAPPPGPGTRPDRATIDNGRVLASLGNCNVCHTVEGGATFAGGRPLATPFGTLYSTNITPDPATGIGRWSIEDFRRAMREGVAPDGRQLYPAFPYDHFARVDLRDIDAIYAYLMTREGVRASVPPNALRAPFGTRPLIAAWKLMYFHPEPIVPDPSQSPEWNRGRYLVEGLAHCGACHSPRNAMGAEQNNRGLSGGDTDGWHAPALDETSVAPTRWTVDALVIYLRDGFDERHGASRGPMAPVTRNLANVPEADVRAISVYIASLAGRSTLGPSLAGTREGPTVTPGSAEGALLYEGACASCHDRTLSGVQLENSTAVTDVVPTNIIRVITDGLSSIDGEPSRAMPGFRGAFTSEQTAALVRYIRARYSRASPWPDVEAEVSKVRAERPSRSAS
jgi:mono/diheme cytochrome c family protein